MRRKAIIFHGTGANPEVCWYPWLGRQLASLKALPKATAPDGRATARMCWQPVHRAALCSS